MLKFYRYACLLLFFPAAASSQGLKLVKQHRGDFYLEYYVQPKNPKAREGLFRKFIVFDVQRLVEEGYYKNGLKDSLWARYNFQGDTIEKGTFSNDLKNGYWKTWIYPPGRSRVLVNEGIYKNGKQVGVWIFRKPDDSLDYKYDYTLNRVVEYGKSVDASIIIDGKDTINAIMEKPPVHIGGMDTLYRSIARNIRMPEELKRNFNQVYFYRAFVSFVIDENGKLTNYAIARGNDKACNEEALRVVKLLDDGNWVPGYYNGHAVKVMLMMPIAFNRNAMGGPPPPRTN